MKRVIIYYDGECPFCHEYTKVIHLKKNFKVKIRNARDYSKRMNLYCKQGFDINKGMIIIVENEILHGSDAVHTINLLSSNNKLVSKFISIFARNKLLLRYVFYPVIKLFREIILIFKNKRKI